MSIRRISGVLFVCALLAAGPAVAEVKIITLDGVGEKGCDDVWVEDGLDVSFTETTAEDCDGGGSCSFGTDETEAWLYPSRLVVDLGGSRSVTRVEVDVVDWCGTGCTRAFAYDMGVSVAAAQSSVGGGVQETLTLIPSGGVADAVAVSSCEGQVAEIRITFGEEIPGGCTSTADCGSFELCVDGECVETWPCEVDGDCDPGWICLDGFCQPGEPVACVADGDCGAGEVCLDGVCVEDSGGQECAADGECGDGEYCVAGACYVASADDCTSDQDCGGGWQCLDGECHPGAGPECTEATDCGAGEICVYGECFDGCMVDGDCEAGAVCVDGACVDQGDAAACAVDGDCAEGETCINGACFAGCAVDGDCGDGMGCVNAVCVKAALPDCATDDECGPGFTCTAGACVPGTAEPVEIGGEETDDDTGSGGSDCSQSATPAPLSGLWLLLLVGALALRRTRHTMA